MSFPKTKSVLALVLIFFLGFISGSLSSPEQKAASVNTGEAITVNDREYFQLMHDLLRSANESIHIVMFEVKWYPDYPDSSMNVILQDLMDAESRGVDVRIVTDEYLTDKPVLTYLKDNGIDIRYDSEETTTHAKLIIVDGKLVMVGSTNWSYYAIENNHEANILLYSPEIARDFESYFYDLWISS